MITYGLARVGPPAVGKEAVAVRGLDVRRVLDRVAGQLGEGLAELGDALLLHLEVALLRHRSVPASHRLGIHLDLQDEGCSHVVRGDERAVQ